MSIDVKIKQSDLISDYPSIPRRYLARYEYLVEHIFCEEDINLFYRRLSNFKKKVTGTPLGNRAEELENSFFAYLFFVHNVGLDQISIDFKLAKSAVSWSLLSFTSKIYADKFLLNNFFQVDDSSTVFKNIRFDLLKEMVGEKKNGTQVFQVCEKISLINILETPGWNTVILKNKNASIFKSIESKKKFYKGFKASASYFFLIIIMCAVLFLSLKLNELNESNLFSKVNLPSRFFTWLDSSSSSISLLKNTADDFSEKVFSINEESQEEFFIEEDRFDVESDVVMASLEQINVAGDRSSLEEKRKGQFRDNRYGSKKVYRLMISSADVVSISKKINSYMDKYNIKTGGSVKPGAQLPGGLYYNLLVPSDKLKSFFSDLDASENMNIYLSKSRMLAPKGQSNVFIWVKKI